MITANGIVRGIDESSSDAEFKENSSQKVIINFVHCDCYNS